MYHFTRVPSWSIVIFSVFCLLQVKFWFTQILDAFSADQSSFIWKGRRFTILAGRSFISDELLSAYGFNVNHNYKLN